MKAIKIYTQESKYYMEDLDTNTTVELTKITKDGISLILPENSAERQFCSITRAEKGITLNKKEHSTNDTKKSDKTTKTKKNDVDYSTRYTPEQKAKVEANTQKIKKLQEEIDAIHNKIDQEIEKEQAIKALEEQAMGLTIEQLKALIAKKEDEAKA